MLDVLSLAYEVAAGNADWPALAFKLSELLEGERTLLFLLDAHTEAVELLASKRNSLHDAHHEAMECLGQMLWESQRAGRPPDGDAYVACVQRRATR